MGLEDLFKFNGDLTRDILVTSLREEFAKAGFKKCIIGLSGGIDSSLSFYLALEALGKENVIGIYMPYKNSSESSKRDVQLLCNLVEVEYLEVDITPQIDTYFSKSDASPLRRGNKMARERMSILYDLSSKHNALVLGTSNKTEILLGYGTIYGDTACAINPLGDLYKTEVRKLSGFMGIPDEIITKSPSADLWVGQTDEQELGFTYEEADQILYLLVDKGMSQRSVINKGYDKSLIEKITKKIISSSYKRYMPVILKVSSTPPVMDYTFIRE